MVALLLATRRRPRFHGATVRARTLTHTLRHRRPRVSILGKHSIRTLNAIDVEDLLIESFIVQRGHDGLFLFTVRMMALVLQLRLVAQVSTVRRVQTIFDYIPLIAGGLEMCLGTDGRW